MFTITTTYATGISVVDTAESFYEAEAIFARNVVMVNEAPAGASIRMIDGETGIVFRTHSN